ncbi:hypothetical protein D8674_014882 [Pyrus ussuriensis x Pyrus communis]|uniref:Uncharacterized protein n=1 Tax=Pyrus ussuriensis x Pyrus communis TaxID=2448454 RepID=A0A5N5GWR7_9ROSA|nr:hypothetical protein D8674_014882 [Pyrus ussuriensis x Pyrus communis]
MVVGVGIVVVRIEVGRDDGGGLGGGGDDHGEGNAMENVVMVVQDGVYNNKQWRYDDHGRRVMLVDNMVMVVVVVVEAEVQVVVVMQRRWR